MLTPFSARARKHLPNAPGLSSIVMVNSFILGMAISFMIDVPAAGTSIIKEIAMPKMKEFTITIEDKPGALGKCFLALAEKGVNILAFQTYVEEGESLARLVVDNPPTAMSVLGGLSMIFEETEVAVIRLANRPGELGRAAARLGEKQINIDYSYCGLEPGSTLALVIFGVDRLTAAANLLDELAVENA